MLHSRLCLTLKSGKKVFALVPEEVDAFWERWKILSDCWIELDGEFFSAHIAPVVAFEVFLCHFLEIYFVT